MSVLATRPLTLAESADAVRESYRTIKGRWESNRWPGIRLPGARKVLVPPDWLDAFLDGSCELVVEVTTCNGLKGKIVRPVGAGDAGRAA